MPRIPLLFSPPYISDVSQFGQKSIDDRVDLVGQKLFKLDAEIGAAMWARLGPAVEMEQSLAVKEMVDRVARTMQSTNAAVLIGAMTPDVVARLGGLGHAPDTADFWLRDTELLHAIREKKQERLASLPLDMWRRLPVLLRDAEPWFDTTDPALIYVFDAGGDAGKIALRINYRDKIRDAAGIRHRIQSNFVRTGGIVEASDVQEPHYKPLFGEEE
jgi:hypothetical protein